MHDELIDAPAAFDYSQLLIPDRIVVQQKTGEIRDRMNTTAQSIVQIGERLMVVREKLPPGMFSDWLGAEFAWSERTAYNFINVAKEFKTAKFAEPNVSPSVLYLLSSSNTPEKTKKKFKKKMESGEPVTHKQVKADIAATKPKPKPEEPTEEPPTPPTKNAPPPAPAPGAFDHLPEAIRPVFEEAAGIFKPILDHLMQVSKLFNQASGGNIEREKGKAMLCGRDLAKDYQDISGQIQKLRHAITSREPVSFCVYCRAKSPKMKTCEPCQGLGWSSKFQWGKATDNMKKNPDWAKNAATIAAEK